MRDAACKSRVTLPVSRAVRARSRSTTGCVSGRGSTPQSTAKATATAVASISRRACISPTSLCRPSGAWLPHKVASLYPWRLVVIPSVCPPAPQLGRLHIREESFGRPRLPVHGACDESSSRTRSRLRGRDTSFHNLQVFGLVLMATTFEATASVLSSIGETAEEDEDEEPTSPASPADTITRLEEIKEALVDSVKALAKVFLIITVLIIFGALTIMSFEVLPTRDALRQGRQ